MAILKDTVVAGSLRATNTIYGTTGQFQTLNIPSSNGGTEYNAGTSGQFARTNGNSAYWGSLSASDININSQTTGTLDVSRGGTGNTTGTATHATTTAAGASDTLYVIGVTSDATTTLKRDTTITLTGGAISITPTSGEGGELRLKAATNATDKNGIAIDNCNGDFRIFGIASADGTTKTDPGTPLVINPYSKTITGGYTITGTLDGSASKINNLTTADAASSTETWRRVWMSYNDNVSGRPAYSDKFVYQTSTNTLKVPHLLIEHTSGGMNEVQIKYSTTVDMALMIDTANQNHGLYDNKASKWMIYGDANGNVQVNGNSTTTTYLQNRGTNVTISDSIWTHNKIGAGDTNTTGGTVWHQRWYQSGLTYTPEGGSATTLSDSGDIVLWLSQTATLNKLWLNMVIDGYVYSQSGFLPTDNNKGTIGTSSLKWNNVYSTTFTGALSGNAASATKVAAKLASTNKTYLLGTQTAITSTAANVDLTGDTGVYLTTTAGELSALKYSVHDTTSTPVEKVRMEWNSTTQSLNFVFV